MCKHRKTCRQKTESSNDARCTLRLNQSYGGMARPIPVKAMRRYLAIGALIGTVAIAYGTLSGVGLPYGLYFRLAPWLGHPRMHTYALMEHLVVFAIFGALLFFAFPGRTILVCVVLVVGASFLEYLQTLTPDRHGTIVDAIEKMTGGLVGVLGAHAATLWRRSLSRRLR